MPTRNGHEQEDTVTIFKSVPNEIVGAAIRFIIDAEVARLASRKTGAQ